MQFADKFNVNSCNVLELKSFLEALAWLLGGEDDDMDAEIDDAHLITRHIRGINVFDDQVLVLVNLHNAYATFADQTCHLSLCPVMPRVYRMFEFNHVMHQQFKLDYQRCVKACNGSVNTGDDFFFPSEYGSNYCRVWSASSFDAIQASLDFELSWELWRMADAIATIRAEGEALAPAYSAMTDILGALPDADIEDVHAVMRAMQAMRRRKQEEGDNYF